jgi:hypothetical protein
VVVAESVYALAIGTLFPTSCRHLTVWIAGAVEIGPEKVADLRVKQLEMVQAIVARVAGNGASLKNWCITVTTAVCGFAISVQRPLVALVAVVFILLFALLDAQYLRVERRFRDLFGKLRSEDWGTIPSFEIDLSNAPAVSYRSALLSWSIINFYAPLAVAVVIVVLISRCVYGI